MKERASEIEVARIKRNLEERDRAREHRLRSLLDDARRDAASIIRHISTSYFRILADAERMTRFSLDIVEIEHVEPAYAEGIRKRGVVVYET